MKRKSFKLLALVLSAIMCINSVNLSVFAEESTEVVEVSTSETSSETMEESAEEVTEEATVTEEGATDEETEPDTDMVAEDNLLVESDSTAEEATETVVVTEEIQSSESTPVETRSYEDAMAELANTPMMMSLDDSVVDEDASDELLLYGNAIRLADSSIQLTPLATWKSGSVWYPNRIDATQGFETSFSYWAGGGRNYTYGGADGITLSFSEKTGLGAQGGGLGFVGGGVAVELDSFPKNSNDPSSKHIAVIKNSSSNHLISKADNRVDDSQWHTLKVAYKEKNLKVYLDDESVPVLELDNLEMPDNFYLGISASTGDGINKHLIKDFYVECALSDATCPIVIVPGVMGSQLYRYDKKVWDPAPEDVLNPYFSLEDYISLGNPLSVHNYTTDARGNLIPINQAGLLEGEREYGAKNTYKNLVDDIIETFTDDNGKCIRDVYFFSYDFRNSNVDSSRFLAKYINDILENNQKYSCVDIVAHSMGGLITSNYVDTYGAGYIRKIITAGTPYEGAPKLVSSVLTRDVLEGELSTIYNWGLEVLGKLTKEVKASFPALAELAPTEEYFTSNVELFKRYSGYRDENLFQVYDNISLNDNRIINSIIFGDTNASNARTFHDIIKNDLGHNVLATLENSYFLIGINQPTISGICYKDGKNLAEINVHDVTYQNTGDGTVPYDSATMMGYLSQIDKSRVCEVTTTHTGAIGAEGEPGAEVALQHILNILSGKDFSQSDAVNKKGYIVIRVACPIDVTISKGDETLSSDLTDLKTYTSYGVLDLLGENGEIKTMCLDMADDYDIVLNGTGTGTMDYSIRYFNADDELLEEFDFMNVTITPDTLITTSSESNNIVLNVDQNNDGVVDRILQPGDCTNDGEMQKLSDTSYLFTTDAIEVVYRIGSQYGDNYHVNVEITNKTDSTIHNWKLAYDSLDTIGYIWNGSVLDEKNYTVIGNVGYNQDILPGQTISFGYIGVKGENIDIPSTFWMLGDSCLVDKDKYEILFNVESDWEKGYNASITIENLSEIVIEDWSVSFFFDETINNIWGGQIVSREDGAYIIQNAGYNQNINPGESVTIGFIVSNREGQNEPTDFELKEVN